MKKISKKVYNELIQQFYNETLSTQQYLDMCDGEMTADKAEKIFDYLDGKCQEKLRDYLITRHANALNKLKEGDTNETHPDPLNGE